MSTDDYKARATGKWRSILIALGIPAAVLVNKHGPCPICSGKDRFRFDDRGFGSYYCNACGAGRGTDLVMKVLKIPFIQAKKLIEEQLPHAELAIPKAARASDPDRYVAMYKAGRMLSGECPASRFLASRGLGLSPWPAQLKFQPRITYMTDDGGKLQLPAMVALFVSPDMNEATVHFTFLDEYGQKAKVEKVRKLAPCKVPAGGAVRLFPSAPEMGIAEGIETALAAHKLFDLPVWSALSTTGLLKWVPPPTAKRIVIFGDNDRNYAGQSKAWSLAHRLAVEGYEVRVEIPIKEGTDWNDVLLSQATPARRVPSWVP